MSILICKQCKESYNTSWSYHNDDYCASCCHIESLEQENAELKENWAELLLFAQEHYAGKFLYVEASEFINKMKELRGGQ